MRKNFLSRFFDFGGGVWKRKRKEEKDPVWGERDGRRKKLVSKIFFAETKG